MEEAEIRKILDEIENELNNDPDHDLEILNSRDERYREKADVQPLRNETNHRINKTEKEEKEMSQGKLNETLASVNEEFEQACLLIDRHEYEDALKILLELTEVIRAFPLPDGMIWMDFSSYLDALVFQDYYSKIVGDQEIRRHPLHPARILYTCGGLLIETGRTEEALDPLEMLAAVDPVCPKYLFELGEAYKRTGNLQDAYEIAFQALACASTRTELARCYRDLGYCLGESGEYEDAMMLYILSLRYQSSRQAEAEIAWIQKKSGISPNQFSYERILQRCEELEIQVGISDTVQENLKFLEMISPDDEAEDAEDEDRQLN